MSLNITKRNNCSDNLKLLKKLMNDEKFVDITYLSTNIDFNVKIELVNTKFNWKKIGKRIFKMIKSENKFFETEP